MGQIKAYMAIAALFGVVACGAQSTRSTAPPKGVSVSLQQWRGDVATHSIEVAVRNETATPVYFSDVQLVSASFTTLPPQRVDTTLGPTPRTDFPIPYGQPRCDPVRIPAVAPAVVVAHLRVGDEPLHEVRFAVPHPDPLLSQFVKAECGAFIVRRSADVVFGDSWDRAGKTLRGVLIIMRRGGGEAVTIQDIGGTTHFNVEPLSGKHRPVTVLGPGESRAEIPVRVTPARCDPHAFAEAKQAYLFPVRVALGKGESYSLISTPSGETQDVFLKFAQDVCGLRG